jgi:hypothetical protein
MNRKIVRNTNDLLALLLLVLIIPALWLFQGMALINLPGEVLGALIAIWTLIAQYYFRKAPEDTTPK